MILRPFRTPEAVWAVVGAALLVATGLLPLPAALAGLAKSLDVCLFLVGMMLLAETARREGLFDTVAAFAVNHAAGSPGALFALVYAAGVVVTVFLSNDATAVVLTPAVFAAARRARTEPLPHLFACAIVANAASFVLPISNPANLVLYAAACPRCWRGWAPSRWRRPWRSPPPMSRCAGPSGGRSLASARAPSPSPPSPAAAGRPSPASWRQSPCC